MGVLACDRTGCPHVMCDYHLRGTHIGFMYICWDCLRELEAHRATLRETCTTRHELEQAIIAFMSTKPGTYLQPEDEPMDFDAELSDIIVSPSNRR